MLFRSNKYGSNINMPLASIASGDQAMMGLWNYVAPMSSSQMDLKNLQILNTSASAMGNSTICMYAIAFPQAVNPYKNIFDSNYDQKRNFIGEKLPHSIAKEFQQAWQSYYAGTHDPDRGAGFLMREVLTHFLLHYAPNERIKEQKEWFVPEPNCDNGISRRHRIEYVVRTNYAPILWEHKKAVFMEILNLYKDFSEQHAPQYSAGNTESLLRASTDILYAFYADKE